MTNKAQFIKDGWDKYHRIVVPKDAPEIQIKETRQAFYAGAAVLWQSIMVVMSAEAEPTDQDIQYMDDIQTELDAFGAQLDRDLLHFTKH